MQIEIPPDAEDLAKGQAAAAGFESVDEYVASLIRRSGVPTRPLQEQTLDRLRLLRARTPKLSADEIVTMAAEARFGLR